MAKVTISFDVKVSDNDVTPSQLANQLAAKLGWTLSSGLTRVQYIKRELKIRMLPPVMLSATQVIQRTLMPEAMALFSDVDITIT